MTYLEDIGNLEPVKELGGKRMQKIIRSDSKEWQWPSNLIQTFPSAWWSFVQRVSNEIAARVTYWAQGVSKYENKSKKNSDWLCRGKVPVFQQWLNLGMGQLIVVKLFHCCLRPRCVGFLAILWGSNDRRGRMTCGFGRISRIDQSSRLSAFTVSSIAEEAAAPNESSRVLMLGLRPWPTNTVSRLGSIKSLISVWLPQPCSYFSRWVD